MPLLSTKCALLLYDGQEGVCRRCGRELIGRQSKWCSTDCEDRYWDQHYWPNARKLALKRDKWTCVKCGSKENLTVDHIIPLMGRGYKSGCYHHLAHLQTLCHDCHVAKTAADNAFQRELRANGKVPGRRRK
jgi:5-methylcytosine-specific restriction endonuclease McrA